MQDLIVFDRLDASRYWVCTVDPSSRAQRRIAEGRFPHWSPDRQSIVFSRPEGAFMSICVMSADGTDVVRLTRGYVDINASWHPDGKALVFNRVGPADAQGNRTAAIMTMRIGERTPAVLTEQVAGWFASAVWRPDGSDIAVASNAFGPAMEVCLMSPRGDSLARLTRTTDGVSGTHLDWSPDGARILFGAFRDGQADVYTIGATGDDEERLTRDPGRIQAGAKWSPDGAGIVYHGTPAGAFEDVIMASELYVMDADGRNGRQLTSSPASNAHPDW